MSFTESRGLQPYKETFMRVSLREKGVGERERYRERERGRERDAMGGVNGMNGENACSDISHDIGQIIEELYP